MADMWTNIGEAVSGPFKIAGAARAGLYDPYGQQRQMNQQRIDMNQLAMAQAKMGELDQAIQLLAADGVDPSDIQYATQQLIPTLEQDPAFQNIPLVKNIGLQRIVEQKLKMAGIMQQQAQEEKAIANQERTGKARQDLFGNILNSNYPNLSPDAQNMIVGSQAIDAGLGPVNPSVFNVKPTAEEVNKQFMFDPQNNVIMVDPRTGTVTPVPDASGFGPKMPETNVSVNMGDQAPIEADVTKISARARELSAQDPQYDYIPKYNSTKGGYYLEPTEKKVPEAAEREKQVKREVSLNNLDRLGELMDFSKIGRVQGTLTKIKNSIGLGDTPDSQELEVLASSMIKNTYVEGGKQLSDKELARLVKYFPIDIGVPDKKFEAQYNLFYSEVKAASELTDEQMERAGFRRINSNRGERAAKEVKSAKSDIPSISTDEEYDKLPSGTKFKDPNGNIRTKP